MANELTITFPDRIAEEISQLPDPQKFVIQAVEHALRSRAPQPGAGPSKWARLVARIESEPGFGDPGEAFEQARKEFRRSFRFKHDES
jgi:hypothetical protein